MEQRGNPRRKHVQRYNCDRCGFTFYRDELRRDAGGWLVCEEDFDEQHPRG